MAKRQVFCKNCMFFRDGEGWQISYCRPPLGKLNCITGKSVRQEPLVLNKKCNCKHYIEAFVCSTCNQRVELEHNG